LGGAAHQLHPPDIGALHLGPPPGSQQVFGAVKNKVGFLQVPAPGELLRALALTPGEREAWLKTLAEPDAALRPLLSELLAQRARLEADEFLEAPAALPEPHEEFRKGQQLGPYRLLRGLSTQTLAGLHSRLEEL